MAARPTIRTLDDVYDSDAAMAARRKVLGPDRVPVQVVAYCGAPAGVQAKRALMRALHEHE